MMRKIKSFRVSFTKGRNKELLTPALLFGAPKIWR